MSICSDAPTNCIGLPEASLFLTMAKLFAHW